jgi:hypothetical protein
MKKWTALLFAGILLSSIMIGCKGEDTGETTGETTGTTGTTTPTTGDAAPTTTGG